jgi:hypothetical protein
MTSGTDEAGESLLFDVRRSIRYHDRRDSHDELLHKVTSATAILVSGMVLLGVARAHLPGWAKWLAVSAALFSVCDIVTDLARNSPVHYTNLPFASIPAEVDEAPIRSVHRIDHMQSTASQQPPTLGLPVWKDR